MHHDYANCCLKKRLQCLFIIFFLGIIKAETSYSAEHGAEYIAEKKTERPKAVGRKAAEKYFAGNENNRSENGYDNEKNRRSYNSDDNYENRRLLGLHFAQFLKSRSYKWGGNEPEDKSGIQALGLTYKMGEWTNTMDLNLRIDYQQYSVHEVKPIKLSFLAAVTFPDTAANFPLYFGGGIGPGVFISQVEDESPISLDYQLFLGARAVNVIGRSGFFVEYGVKDHLLILSDGQFIGQYLAMGMVFSI